MRMASEPASSVGPVLLFECPGRSFIQMALALRGQLFSDKGQSGSPSALWPLLASLQAIGDELETRRCAPRTRRRRYTWSANSFAGPVLSDTPRRVRANCRRGSRTSPSGSSMAGRRAAVLGTISDILSAAPIELRQHSLYARTEGAASKKGLPNSGELFGPHAIHRCDEII